MDGEKSYSSNEIYGSITAQKVTKDWKMIFGLDYSQRNSKFEIEENTIKSINKSNSFDVLIVKSISDHWSVGGSTELGSSTYSNREMQFSLMPGIEYNIFPYSESTRRQFRFLYSIGYNYNKYSEVTIYDKLKENLWQQSLDVSYSIIKKWGYISIGTEWRNYFHDLALNNASFYGEFDVRITKGLSINTGYFLSSIHDQIALVKGEASPNEILLRQKELETQYSYGFYGGISYTFGSIFNNVVNPRFRQHW